MQTQNSDTTDIQAVPPQTPRPRSRHWLLGVSAIAVVVLVLGIGGVVAAQLLQHQGDQQPSVPAPASGKWVQVLNGYTILSLAAARNDPARIYACAIQVQSSGASKGVKSHTLLHSTDFGAHWQDLGSKANLGNVCDFAINPTDSNEIFAVASSGGSNVLRHSTDGGQTWSTITPTLQTSGLQVLGLQSAPPWNVRQLTMEGNQLFGVQVVSEAPLSLPVRPISARQTLPLLHLVTSADGGYTWGVIDGKPTTNQLSLRGFAVDATDPNTIYELVGLPAQVLILPRSTATPHGIGSDLYKTTDGGTTWQSLAQGLPLGTQIQLATNKPNLVYIGGSLARGPLLLGIQLQGSARPNGASTNFFLSISSDGGTTWRQLTTPSHVQRWFVGPDGQVYADTGNALAGQSGPYTVTVGITTPIPRNTPNPGGQPIIEQPTLTPTPTDIPSSDTGVTVPTAPPTTPIPTVAQPAPIQVYDPATDSWGQAIMAPTIGGLVAVTPTGTTGGAALWFFDTVTKDNLALYRFVLP